MEALPGKLRDRGLGVIVVRAGLLNLLFEILLVLLGRGQSFRGGLGLAFRLLRGLLRGFGGLHRRGNLIVVQIGKLQDDVGQIAAHAGELCLQLGMVGDLRLVFGYAHGLGFRRRRGHRGHARGAQHRGRQHDAHDGTCPANYIS